jgi:farnesyl-diphosphate farnesyltransferase
MIKPMVIMNAPTLRPAEQEYLRAAMNKVSRSFALVVPWIEAPLNDYFATAYLLCRVVDNIEDCAHPFAWQSARFAELRQMLADPALAPELLAQWEQAEWPGLTGDEAALMSMAGGATLWQVYGQIPPLARSTIAHWTCEMIAGMEAIEDPNQTTAKLWRQGIRLLATEQDYNQYCYYVAGTVGHLGTQLVIDHFALGDELAERLLGGADACGRGLQKTNIVKDFVDDLGRGVCYLPDEWLQEVGHQPLDLAGAPAAWSQRVVGNVLQELGEAVAYVTALPVEVTGYRMASLLCLLPAYQTLLKAAQAHATLFTPSHNTKISRDTMLRCVEDASSLVADNEGIVHYSRQVEQLVGAAFGEFSS